MLLPKRQRTRVKLLDIAQQMILDKGCKDLSLRDICFAADMSAGTIYNYYRNLEEIFADVEQMLISAYYHTLNNAIKGIEDPICVVAASARQTLSNALPGSPFGKIVFEGKLPHDTLMSSIRDNFIRDMLAAEQAGLFKIEKHVALLSMITGGMYGAMTDLYHKKIPVSAIEDLAEIHLTMLGVSKERAQEAARIPFEFQKLPELPLSAARWLPDLEKSPKKTKQNG